MRKSFLGYVLLSLYLCLSFTGLARAETASGITIVASIRPLALLLNDLVLPLDNVVQLVRNSSSAHHYQLKVSDRRLLQSADLVVWVGPELELFLDKPLKQVKRGGNKVVALSDAPGIQWLSEDEEQASQHGHDGHHHSGRDPHIWLNPVNLKAMASQLTTELIRLSPERATAYQQRADIFINKLTTLDEQLKDELRPIREKPFIVLHPAYSHFIHQYGLNQINYVVINPESVIGAKHLYKLSQYKLVCVFGEVGEGTQRVDKIAASTKAKTGQLDPLGLSLSDAAGMTGILRKLADDFRACLQ